MEIQTKRVQGTCPASGVQKDVYCYQGKTSIGGVWHAADECAWNNLGIAYCSKCEYYSDWCGWALCWNCGKTWIEILLHILEVAKGIFTMLTPMQQCMDGLPNPQYHTMNVLQFFGSRVANPFKLIGDTLDVYVNPAIVGAMVWAQNMSTGGFQRVTQEQQDKENVEEQILEGGEDQANVDAADQASNNTAAKRAGSMEWLGGIADKAMALLEDLANQPGLEIGYCLMETVLKPGYNAVRNKALDIMEMLVDPILKVMTEMQNKMTTWVSQQLAQLASQDTWFGRLILLGEDAAGLVCMEQMTETSVKLEKFRATLAQPMGNPNASAEFAEFQAYLGKPMDILPVAIKALELILLQLEPWFIEKLVTPALNFLVETLNWILGLVLHGVDAIAGLIPEVGAIISALVTSAVQGAQNWISQSLFTEGMKLIKLLWRGLTGFVISKMRLLLDPALQAQIQNTLGAFAPLLDLVKTFLWQMLPDTNGKLAECATFKQSMKDMLEMTKSSITP
jgi:hypothetical protein